MQRHLIFIASIAGALAGGVMLGAYWEAGRSDPPSAESPAAAAGRAGPYQVAARVEPPAPVIGENTLVIELRDLAGNPVTGARVQAVATMPAMGAMPAMQAPATIAETEPGRYEGPFTLSMDGSWPITLEIAKDGVGEGTLRFDMATRRAGLTPSSAGAMADAASAEEPPAGTIQIDARRRQAIGLRTARVERVQLQRRIRALGHVSYDQTRLSDISLRFDAWIGELNADYVGVAVREGETLFTVYGPELLAAQQEYLEARRRASSGPLIDAARKRLELWNLTGDTIAALERRGTPFDYVPIAAPQSGTVIGKNIVAGTAQRAGGTLLRIADLSRVWVEAEVYEADLALVSPGMAAVVTVPYLPAFRAEGTVEYVYPTLDAQSRTARVRVALDNPDGILKPEMYAEVALLGTVGERLAIPLEAVIFAGERRVVFEDLGDGRLAPRYVRTGIRAGELVEVVEGLEAGNLIVASGTFLIASESRLQSGIDQW